MWRADFPFAGGALLTGRNGGVSGGDYRSLNLSFASGDAAEAVAENRRRLVELMSLPSPPRWVRLAHGARALCADNLSGDKEEADALFTTQKNVVCAVTVADCLPVFVWEINGRCVGVAHAGWRGLAAGVVENLIEAMRAVGMAAFAARVGPSICAKCYEVGEEVRARFPDGGLAFTPLSKKDKYLADLKKIALEKLKAQGVDDAAAATECTFCEKEKFFSARRDGAKSGRMAALIWRQ